MHSSCSWALRMAELPGCLRSCDTLGSNASCPSYFRLCFGLQRRKWGASVFLLSSLFEVKPNKRGPTLIPSAAFPGAPQGLDPLCTSTRLHGGSCLPQSSRWLWAQKILEIFLHCFPQTNASHGQPYMLL